MHTYINTCIHAYIHTYIHTHTCCAYIICLHIHIIHKLIHTYFLSSVTDLHELMYVSYQVRVSVSYGRRLDSSALSVPSPAVWAAAQQV